MKSIEISKDEFTPKEFDFIDCIEGYVEGEDYPYDKYIIEVTDENLYSIKSNVLNIKLGNLRLEYKARVKSLLCDDLASDLDYSLSTLELQGSIIRLIGDKLEKDLTEEEGDSYSAAMDIIKKQEFLKDKLNLLEEQITSSELEELIAFDCKQDSLWS